MKVAVSGSIAEDYLMSFPGRFAKVIVPEQLARLSLSFLVDDLNIRRGGVGANIAYAVAQHGVSPLLIGAVGPDFSAGYEVWLKDHGVDTAGVMVSPDKHTARFLCTTDEAQSQIASFYTGAMADARNIGIGDVVDREGPIDVLLVAPNDPEAMLRHTREGLELGIAVFADPSQQLARLEGEEIRPLLDGAAYLIGNDYERAIYEDKSGWSGEEVLRRVGVRITTFGADGVVIDQRGEPSIRVPSVPPSPDAELEPTGAGDAFRGGFLAGLARSLDFERCAQVGCLTATLALETVGPQEYEVDWATAEPRLAAAYGAAAAEELVATMTTPLA